MNRLIAAAIVLLTGTTARADMGAPWPITRRVPVRVTITADPPPPGVEVVLLSNSEGMRLFSAARPMSSGSPVVLESNGQWVIFDVYTVPSATLAQFKDRMPPLGWFGPTNPACRYVGGVHLDGRLGFFAGGSEVVREYRVERQGDSAQLRTVSDNVPNWWPSGPCGLVVSAALIWLIWLGVRRARQRASRQPS
jgi:hypothetical protein